MPCLRAHVPGRGGAPGGIVRYPLARLREEVAYLAFHFHWPYDQVMNMEHAERQEWVDEVARINTHLNQMGAPVEA